MSIKPIDITKTTTPKAERAKQKKQKDLLHDTPLRYTGYCDDIGAATRVVCNKSSNFLVKNLPAFSYVPVAAYITADVVNTYNKAKKSKDDNKIAGKKAFSQLIFQGLTSIAAPILVVGATQKGCAKAFDKFIPALREQVSKNGTKMVNRSRDVALALMGLGSLIALSKPIDNLCDKVVMDKVVNPALGIKNEGAKASCEESKSKLNTTQG